MRLSPTMRHMNGWPCRLRDYFAPPNAPFNSRGVFWVVFEGCQRGIYAEWNMANEATIGASGNSHRRLRGWDTAVDALTKHVWDQGFCPEDTPHVAPSPVSNSCTPCAAPISNAWTPHVTPSPPSNSRAPPAAPSLSNPRMLPAAQPAPHSRSRVQQPACTPSQMSNSIHARPAAVPRAYTSVTSLPAPLAFNYPRDEPVPTTPRFTIVRWSPYHEGAGGFHERTTSVVHRGCSIRDHRIR
ncbi:hypothetical protein MSAN_02041900 [Mycena sanguinolenta]|uniref:Uncharacterized protein n=1 Tax=Mycena sanguinolenta TaxID=230812 RepID=A0A8H7CNL2_9AGAR|nr:hypothetical protein MSAN_02041900 [Mycena sanguinolenta]